MVNPDNLFIIAMLGYILVINNLWYYHEEYIFAVDTRYHYARYYCAGYVMAINNLCYCYAEIYENKQ